MVLILGTFPSLRVGSNVLVAVHRADHSCWIFMKVYRAPQPMGCGEKGVLAEVGLLPLALSPCCFELHQRMLFSAISIKVPFFIARIRHEIRSSCGRDSDHYSEYNPSRIGCPFLHRKQKAKPIEASGRIPSSRNAFAAKMDATILLIIFRASAKETSPFYLNFVGNH